MTIAITRTPTGWHWNVRAPDGRIIVSAVVNLHCPKADIERIAQRMLEHLETSRFIGVTTP